MARLVFAAFLVQCMFTRGVIVEEGSSLDREIQPVLPQLTAAAGINSPAGLAAMPAGLAAMGGTQRIAAGDPSQQAFASGFPSGFTFGAAPPPMPTMPGLTGFPAGISPGMMAPPPMPSMQGMQGMPGMAGIAGMGGPPDTGLQAALAAAAARQQPVMDMASLTGARTPPVALGADMNAERSQGTSQSAISGMHAIPKTNLGSPGDSMGAFGGIGSAMGSGEDMHTLCPAWRSLCGSSAWTRANCMRTCAGNDAIGGIGGMQPLGPMR